MDGLFACRRESAAVSGGAHPRLGRRLRIDRAGALGAVQITGRQRRFRARSTGHGHDTIGAVRLCEAGILISMKSPTTCCQIGNRKQTKQKERNEAKPWALFSSEKGEVKMPKRLHPGVYVEEVPSGVRPIE